MSFTSCVRFCCIFLFLFTFISIVDLQCCVNFCCHSRYICTFFFIIFSIMVYPRRYICVYIYIYICMYIYTHIHVCIHIYIYFNSLIWQHRVLVETREIFSMWHTESLVAAFKLFVSACGSRDPTQAPCIQRMES